jgi:Arc/MetJ-type ribon-helix-helix transcriptional regulator
MGVRSGLYGEGTLAFTIQETNGQVEGGLYNSASEVVREDLRLLKEQDEIRLKRREQIERA